MSTPERTAKALPKDEGRRMKDETRAPEPPNSDSSFIIQPSSFPEVTLRHVGGGAAELALTL